MKRTYTHPKDALFSGVFPEGIVYADRRREKHGDYVKVAFLSFRTLELQVYKEMPEDLRQLVEDDALKIQRRKGELYPRSSSGQHIRLGWGLTKNA